MHEDEALKRKLNEVEKWACCGEPEMRVRAEHENMLLKKALSELGGPNYFEEWLKQKVCCKCLKPISDSVRRASGDLKHIWHVKCDDSECNKIHK